KFSAQTQIYTLSLHDALPIFMELVMENTLRSAEGALQLLYENTFPLLRTFDEINMKVPDRLRLPVETAVNTKLVNYLKRDKFKRSEEHTSELQSRENLVCRLL